MLAINKKHLNECFINILRENNQKVLTVKEFECVKKDVEKLQNTTIGMEYPILLKELEESGIIKIVTLTFPTRKETRILTTSFHILDLAKSLRKGGYFSHLTAAHLHSLTPDTAKTLYFNYPQPPRFGDLELSQNRIDAAFSRPARISNNSARYNEWTLYLLNSMGYLGVGIESVDHPESGSIRVTTLARTLIDLAVRPTYGGGPRAVLNLYRKAARRKVDVKEMLKLLTKLEFTYPYHQAIGFYLERTKACTHRELSMIKSMPQEFNFYLDNQIAKPAYDKRWRLYYPTELDEE